MSEVKFFSLPNLATDEVTVIERPWEIKIPEEILALPKEEYKKRGVINSAHNAQVLTCVFDACGLVAPQDLLYEADLKVGDVILLMVDGELRRRTIAKVHQGIEVGKEVGLLKTDKWIKAPIKETEK